MRILLGLVVVLGVGMLEPGLAGAAELEAGLASADITPPVPYRMSGYFFERPSTGTHNPLQAKAIVLRQGTVEGALVLCDLIGMSPAVSQAVRSAVEERFGIPADNVLVAATHSHTGPLYMGSLRDYLHRKAMEKQGSDPYEQVDYPAELTRKLIDVIGTAQAALAPVRLAAGSARQEGLSFNRRFHMKGGGPVVFNPGKLNPQIDRPAGPIDPQVGLLLFRSPEGKALGSLAVFALHLDTVGGTEYAADYPYYLSESLRAKFGPAFLSVFGNGTCGDINHIDVSHDRPQQGQQEARRIGETLAGTVAAALDTLPAVESPNLGVRSVWVHVPLQKPSADEVAWAKSVEDEVLESNLPFLERVRACTILDLQRYAGDTVALQVQVFRLGDETAVVGLPGEIFVDLGLAIKKASPFRTTMVIELANNTVAYFPTRKAFEEGSYEIVNSRVVPGGSEMLVDAAVKQLDELNGTK